MLALCISYEKHFFTRNLLASVSLLIFIDYEIFLQDPMT